MHPQSKHASLNSSHGSQLVELSGMGVCRYVAALLPALMTLRFMLAGLGITYEPRLVAGTARTGQREELLAGPTLYGLAHVLLTVIAWRNNPPAAAGLAALCAGDGLADVLGRRWGNRGPLAGTLPHNRDKTWVGTATCFLAGFAATAAYVLLFNYLGYYNHFCSSQGPHWSCAKAGKQHLAIGPILLGSAVSAGAAALVETMPGHDNLTVPAVAAAAIWLLL
eukprot:GHRR01012744.1.p1 GENE.GHRR01012744.1~~GHRR01012744.1.p1  ORF type:complete len:223 (+),score=75.04 GHRR01012744.1:674-1342(+)